MVDPDESFGNYWYKRGVSSIVWDETAVLLLFKILQLFRFDIVICLRLIFSEEI